MCVQQAFAKISKAASSKPCRAHFRHTPESLEGPVPEDAPSMEKSELFVKPSVAQEKPRKQYNSIEQGCESRPDVGLVGVQAPCGKLAVSSGNWRFRLRAREGIGRIRWSRVCKGFSGGSNSGNDHITVCLITLPWPGTSYNPFSL